MKWYDLASINLTIIQAEGISIYILNIKTLQKNVSPYNQKSKTNGDFQRRKISGELKLQKLELSL